MKKSLLFKFEKRQRGIALFPIFAFLLSWVGVAQGMPFLLILMGPSHKVFLTKHFDNIQLVIHHPGNQDEHETQTGGPIKHEHDLLDGIIAATAGGNVSHSDHEIQLSDDKERFIASAKTVSVPKTSLLVANSQLWPVFVKPAPFRNPAPPLLKTKPRPVSLLTTVFLI